MPKLKINEVNNEKFAYPTLDVAPLDVLRIVASPELEYPFSEKHGVMDFGDVRLEVPDEDVYELIFVCKPTADVMFISDIANAVDIAIEKLSSK